MKKPWNDMIPLLPLQEFMPLTSVQGQLRASTPCSIFYVDSLQPPMDVSFPCRRESSDSSWH
ncbi:hypothetical protein B296_00058569 [Ensete ventricosum]|uniref:Uncharacterized protein n=1 Tax=Ensete ventricosum TaxID=4639 RepID=A0A426WY59_ENSVE|nr:hypothetical protein B296_00058569 [Ensete ventricosum]